MNDQVEGHANSAQSLPASAAPTATSSREQDHTSHDGETAKTTAADIKDKVSDDIRSASDFAKQEIANVSDKAKEAADQQKNFFADRMSGVAQAMEKVAEELEQSDNREIGKMTRTLGSSMRKFSDDIQNRSLGEIAGMAEDFGRKQPLAFLGIAAIAGLAASRFLAASPPQANGSSGKPTASTNTPGPAPIGLTPTAPSAKPLPEGRING